MASNGHLILQFKAVWEVSCSHYVTLFAKDFEPSNSAVFMTRPCKVTCSRVDLQITEDFGVVLLFLKTVYEERA